MDTRSSSSHNYLYPSCNVQIPRSSADFHSANFGRVRVAVWWKQIKINEPSLSFIDRARAFASWFKSLSSYVCSVKQTMNFQLLSPLTSMMILSSASLLDSIWRDSRNFLNVSSVITCVLQAIEGSPLDICIAAMGLEFAQYPKFRMRVLKSFFCEYLACDSSKSSELFLVRSPAWATGNCDAREQHEMELLWRKVRKWLRGKTHPLFITQQFTSFFVCHELLGKMLDVSEEIKQIQYVRCSLTNFSLLRYVE